MQRWMCAALAALFLTDAARAQGPGQPNEGLTLAPTTPSGSFSVNWWGKGGRSYFILHTSDLLTWSFIPIIESGNDGLIQWGVSSPDGQGFWMLQGTDIATTNPYTDDFNGAGMSNFVQISANMSPLVPVPVVTVTSPTWVSVGP